MVNQVGVDRQISPSTFVDAIMKISRNETGVDADEGERSCQLAFRVLYASFELENQYLFSRKMAGQSFQLLAISPEGNSLVHETGIHLV